MKSVPTDGIGAAIGRTPLIRLTRLFAGLHFQLFAKLEGLNPGGSMKDRPAFHMLRRAIENGTIDERTVVVESSSGNMGIGLAQACRYYGLRFICVVDPKITAQNRRLIELYGGHVDMVAEPDEETGDFLVARLNRVRAIVASHPRAFWPNQYANLDNADAHVHTMREIVEALDDAPEYVFCATSTCGTVRGCATYLRRSRAATKTIAVDAVGSVIFGGLRGRRLIPGHGAAVRPALYHADMADAHVLVSDLDCVMGCHRLLRNESILAGGSSGAVVAGVQRLQRSIPADARCVMILADRGERYLDSIYSEAWIGRHFGDAAARDIASELEACAATDVSSR
jgi:N-(2-amino-2-carboxyethyl)-L-glutamate synthase